MHLLEVELSNETLLIEKFKALQIEISEYSFANIFLFRKEHHYQLYFDKELFIKGITRDGRSYLMPTFSLENFSTDDLAHWLKEVDFLFPIPEKWISLFDPKIFHCFYKDCESDYLIKRERLASLEGRDLSKKRNLIKQLLENHVVQDYPMTSDHFKDALTILDVWQKNQNLDPERNDYFPCQEAIHLMYPLQLTGRIFYIDNKPVAFLLGETLTNKQYAIHFAKADKNIKGLYQYLFQRCAQELDTTIEYINFEQDLDLPQVHQSKHSYHPDKMERKYRVTLR